MLTRLMDSIVAALRRLLGGAPEPPTTRTGTEPKLLVCPNEKEVRAEQTIGPEGGTLKLDEHRLVVPKGGVAEKVSFTAVLLADRTLKVQLQANGKDSYRFVQPAALTLGYGRCDPPADAKTLRVYKIDPTTGKVLQDLGGKVDERERSVTASLDGFSIYTLGSPTDKPAPELP